MDNQMEKKMENEMETREYIGVLLGLYSATRTLKSSPTLHPCLDPHRIVGKPRSLGVLMTEP